MFRFTMQNNTFILGYKSIWSSHIYQVWLISTTVDNTDLAGLEQVVKIEENTLSQNHPDQSASQHKFAIVYHEDS